MMRENVVARMCRARMHTARKCYARKRRGINSMIHCVIRQSLALPLVLQQSFSALFFDDYWICQIPT